MNILTALKTLSDYEIKMAELYGWYSELFAGDEKFSAFFNKMKLEEISHQNQIKFQQRLLLNRRGALPDLAVDEEEVRRFIETLARALAEPPKGIAEAIDMACALETSLYQRCHAQSLLKDEQGLAKLFTSLGSGDQKHLADLKQLAASLGAPHP
mgnify:CR=1 FL=1